MIGEVKVAGNSNAKLSGERNKGTVSNNSNLKVNSINSFLNLFNNSNASVSIQNSRLILANCMNATITGKGNTVELRGNSNPTFRGNDNKWEGNSNSNCYVTGDNSVVRLESNCNAIIEGDMGQIVCENNTNLKVSGDGNKVTVKHTNDHAIQRSQDNMNKVEIIQGMQNSQRGSVLASLSQFLANNPTTTSQTTKWSCNVDYVDEAVLEKEGYRLGIFNFNLRYAADKTSHNVTIDQTGLDRGSLVAHKIGGGEILISASKDGVKQSLKLKGPQVSQVEPPTGSSFRISML